MVQWLKQMKGQERGAALPEYGLLVALIAVVAIAGVTLVGNQVLAVFNNIAASL